MQFRYLGLAAALAGALAVAGSANAQSAASGLVLAKPVEFYFDADALATKPIIAVRESGDAATAKLVKLIDRNPGAKAELAQLAHLAMAGGRVDLGRELYDRALRQISPTTSLWRPLLWNYGWDLYRAGDAAAALGQWHGLMASRGITPAWLPPTLAVTLWTLGRKAEAVQWYAAAVRTQPEHFRSTAHHAQALPNWSAAERTTLAAVHAAWAAAPPRWP